MCVHASSVWKLCTELVTCVRRNLKFIVQSVRRCVILNVHYYMWELCFLTNQTIMKCRPIMYKPAKLLAQLHLHTINFPSFICVVTGVEEYCTHNSTSNNTSGPCLPIAGTVLQMAGLRCITPLGSCLLCNWKSSASWCILQQLTDNRWCKQWLVTT